MAKANVVWDAGDPETISFGQLVQAIRIAVRSRVVAVLVRPGVTRAISSAIRLLARDVVWTKDEIRGIITGLLVSKEPPMGKLDLRHRLGKNTATFGVRSAGE